MSRANPATRLPPITPKNTVNTSPMFEDRCRSVP